MIRVLFQTHPPPLFLLSQVKLAIPLCISRWFYGIGGVLVVLWLWIRENWTSCTLTLINAFNNPTASKFVSCFARRLEDLNFLWSLMELGWCRLYVGCCCCCCCRFWFMDFTPLFELFTDLLSIHLTTDRGWEEIGHRGRLMVPGEDFE